MNNRRMVKKRWIVVIVIVLVLVVILGVFYLLQQDNLRAVANARKYSQEQLLGKLDDNRQLVEDALTEQYPGLQVRDLTDDERAALRKGTMSRDELIAALLGPGESGNGASGTEPPATTPSPVPGTSPPDATPTPAQTAAPAETNQPAETAGPTETTAPAETASPEPSPEDEYNARLAALIAEIYVMREEYVALLDAMVEQAKGEYAAMPESERTRTKLLNWASGYVSEASVLEKQCDARMDGILAELKALAEEYGADTGIVSTIANFYAEEKSLQKSLYIQELEKRGIL